MDRFEPSIESLSRAVDDELHRFLASKRRAQPEAAPMVDEIARLVQAGGKRLRPQFCYWGFRAAGGGHSASIVAASAALELLHTFAIVHDDIMDSSAERRGLPTTFALLGTDIALLVGDLALVLADAALMESGFDAASLERAWQPYSRMRQQVIAGQYLDVRASAGEEISLEDARRIAVLKSGRYSIEEPLVIGAALAGAPEQVTGWLHAFGGPLGEAFQLRDDLLGTFGDARRIGKPVDSDIREGKRHVLYAYALEGLSGDERGGFIAAWGTGASLTDAQVEALRDALVRSGARTKTEELLDALTGQALGTLEGARVDPQAHAALTELAHRATDRAL